MHNLQKPQLIDPSSLDQQYYLQSLLQEGMRAKFLSQTGLEKIQMQMLEILAFETGRYTHGESSSVRIETAEELFKSIAYTLGVFLKTMNPEDAVGLLQDKTLNELLSSGRGLIKKKFRVAKLVFMECKASGIKTPNLAYNDTLETGILSFFGAYDIEFGAHETPAMIDYPIWGEPIQTEGIEYILEYTKRLLLENQYCSMFSARQIHAAMLKYDFGYADLLVNIYGQVLKCLSTDGTLPEEPLEKAGQPAQFDDGIRMEDEELRSLLEELGNLRLASDKVKMIRQKVRSFFDLLDILSSGCLFGAEFDAVFESIDEPFLALLLRETADREDLHATEYEKEWQDNFARFFQTLEPARRTGIIYLSKEITLHEYF